ncbi:MAG: hypothetical protein JST92_09490 [Deltaproteobacteria bacterium]|nr:hypothetical protein [Deltaproteobacteria bacterium]
MIDIRNSHVRTGFGLAAGLAVGLVLSLSLSSPVAAQEAGGCGKDTDCKGSRVCIKHVCVDPPAVRACGKDTDCPGEEICLAKKCQLPKPKPGADMSLPAAQPAQPDKAPPLPEAKPAPAPATETTVGPGGVLVTVPAQPVQKAAPPPEPKPEPKPETKAAPPPEKPKHEAAPETRPAPKKVEEAASTPAPPLVLVLDPPAGAKKDEAKAEANKDEPGGPGQLIGGARVGIGLHRWASYKPLTDTTSDETDFGFKLGLDGGVRVSEHVALQLVGEFGYTFMVDGVHAWQVAVGGGLRIDRLWPGCVGIAGVGSFGTISSDTFSLDFSGGGLLIDGGYTITGPWSVHGQVGFLFLNQNLSEMQATIGLRFGN